MINSINSIETQRVPAIRGPIKLPLKIGNSTHNFELKYFEYSGERYAVACLGEVSQDEYIPLRIESACLFGHVFNSDKCDCGFQLKEALKRIAEHKKGMVIYAIDQDARGLGIESHFRIYVMRQHENLDTDELYNRLGSPVDARNYEHVADILQSYNIKKILLMSNNRHRREFLTEKGFQLEIEPIEAPLNFNNMATLMLEKEDLPYDFHFKTHSDWLKSIQEEVDGDLNATVIQIISGTEEVILHSKVLETWNLASEVTKNLTNNDLKSNDSNIIYLTDFPRIDELESYSAIGAKMIVLPFSEIPSWLYNEAEKHKIIIQDWGRKNKYVIERPQWNLLKDYQFMHVYVRGDKTRCVFVGENSNQNMNYLMEGYKNLNTILLGSSPEITHIFEGDCPWFELQQPIGKANGISYNSPDFVLEFLKYNLEEYFVLCPKLNK
ncbi:hypothetical protein [Paenibacillus sp. YYML68]|uniref:hypothetical protein n=1 Tax=Paenibacillus sp. YYML68 TaxID=2909250 RepID=UPI0024929E4D|nr:hypothetical protein [Paenibacillus sp. YYML68]